MHKRCGTAHPDISRRVLFQRSAVVVGNRDSICLPIAAHVCPDHLAKRSGSVHSSYTREPDCSSAAFQDGSDRPASGLIIDQVMVHPVAQTSSCPDPEASIA